MTTESKDKTATEAAKPLLSGALASLLSVLSQADVNAARRRVEGLKQQFPEATPEELSEQIVKKKIQQTAMVGAASSGAGLIPGLGTITALTVGFAADLSATFKLQAEMVLELALLNDYPLSKLDQQKLIFLVTGVSMGSSSLINRAGKKLSLALTERYAKRWLAKAIPFFGVAASSSTNALTTYLIANRAQAYFQGSTEEMSWFEGLRRLSGFDERKIASWLKEKAGFKGSESDLDKEVATLKAKLLEKDES
ncbi:MAG: hypothetical protein KC422_12185 [Trueperaceae bacterium]|nr:hypothetical protein [Trueperaceae bacterium]